MLLLVPALALIFQGKILEELFLLLLLLLLLFSSYFFFSLSLSFQHGCRQFMRSSFPRAQFGAFPFEPYCFGAKMIERSSFLSSIKEKLCSNFMETEKNGGKKIFFFVFKKNLPAATKKMTQLPLHQRIYQKRKIGFPFPYLHITGRPPKNDPTYFWYFTLQ